MNNSKAYIEEAALINWKSKMASINNDSIKILNDYQNKVNELNNYMKGNVAEGFINDETSTIKEILSKHENMKDLEKFINIVVEKMKSY